MVDAAQVLRAGGIVADPAEVIAAAAEARLPLAAMAPKLKRESYGGRNVVGNDRVDDGGQYVKGGNAGDRAMCLRYLAWRGPAGRNRRRQQGWGPSQLTWAELQDAAERRGGLHVARINMVVGALELARCYRQGGSWRDAGALYNGGSVYAKASSDARGYGDWLADAVADWTRLLAGASTPPAPGPAPSTGGRPVLREGDTSELVWRLQQHLNRVFPAYSRIDVPTRPPSRLGPQTRGVLEEFQRRSGIPTAPPFEVGERTWAALADSGFRP